MHLDLSPDERKEVIDRIVNGTVEKLLSEHRDELDMISPAQAAGILDVAANTLTNLDLPRITIIPGKVYRYRASAIKQYLAENEA